MVSVSSRLRKRIMLEELFYKNEVTDHVVYRKLAEHAKDVELSVLLHKLSMTEEKHMKIWKKMLSEDSIKALKPRHISIKVLAYKLIRRIFGLAFVIKLLERNEAEGLEKYREAASETILNDEEKGYLKIIINDERKHEELLIGKVQEHAGSLKYIESIVFGLNDGVVEVLAAVAGLAAFAQANIFVVIGGIVIAISGVSSMTGGAYLASKSKVIIGKGIKGSRHEEEEPLKEAYYTGLFYFIGALLPILPFIFGQSGYTGIVIAAVLSAIGLSIASMVIAVVGDTSITKRIAETLAISFAATIITTIIGTVAKAYFKV